jgi:hypothetical protein
MQNHRGGLTSGGRRHGGIALLLVCAVFAVSACNPPVVSIPMPMNPDRTFAPNLVNIQAPNLVRIAVNSDGTFTPNPVNIRVGQTIQWEGLSRTDSIVQIGDPTHFSTSDVCGIADNDLDHAFAATDLNEFTGPSRKAVSGIFVLGPNEGGFVQRLATESCKCEEEDTPCDPLRVKSVEDGNYYKLCPRQGAINQMLDTTWSNPDITGVILRLNWRDIQRDNNGVIEFFWDDLDREMNHAVESGKLFTLDVRAGQDGTPDWIFNTYPGPAGPGPVAPLTFKDWGSDSSPPANSCGYSLTIGSPVETAYRDLYTAMINELATHVASDSRWFQSLAHVKISGANFLSSEARLPKRCLDNPSDGVLDVITKTNGLLDYCHCNSKIWADAGYTPDGLYEYYRVVGNTIYNAFFQRKSLGYQLIQDGFPKVESATNFEGDALQDQFGNFLLLPRGVPANDPNGIMQTTTVLRQGRNGRFVDPFGAVNDPAAGKLFVPQHNGLGRLPEDGLLPGCSQAMAVDSATLQASFPITPGTPGGHGPGCPNPWAVDQGTLHSQVMGFQTQNPSPGGVTSPADVESALWNLTINSNGVFIELYEQRVWEISHTLRTGPDAAVLDANRIELNANPAPYSKNLFTWSEELHERRKQLVDQTNPHLGDPFPASHQHTFSKVIVAPETYYYINPVKCWLTTDPNRVGQITVSP